jgi:hypothetical protein
LDGHQIAPDRAPGSGVLAFFRFPKDTTMPLCKLLLPAIALIAVPVLSSPTTAQQRNASAYRASNAQATIDMRARMAAAIDRVAVTEGRGKLSPARAAGLRERIVRARRQMAGFERQQGFVSAAELASYDRLLVGINAELGAVAGKRPHDSDTLRGAEMLAFQRIDKRLGYRNARIDHDTKGCAIYRGITHGGRDRREPLRDPRGRPICPRR